MRNLVCAAAIFILCGFVAGPLQAADCSGVTDQIAASRNNPKELRKLLGKAPQCDLIWKVLGDFYYAKGIWNESKDCYEEALKISPGNKEVQARLQELRPKTTSIIKDDRELLSYRKSIGGVASAGAQSGATAPSTGGAENERIMIASAPPDRSPSKAPAEKQAAPEKTARHKPKPAAEAARPAPEKVGLIISFDYNSAQLTPESEKLLASFSEVLNKELSGRRFLVQGHTDNIGERHYNKQLSVERAESVKKYLASNGVDPFRLEVQGFGYDKPIYDNETEQGRAKNRRVEFQEK